MVNTGHFTQCIAVSLCTGFPNPSWRLVVIVCLVIYWVMRMDYFIFYWSAFPWYVKLLGCFSEGMDLGQKYYHLWMTGGMKAFLWLSLSLIALLTCLHPLVPCKRSWWSVLSTDITGQEAVDYNINYIWKTPKGCYFTLDILISKDIKILDSLITWMDLITDAMYLF